MKSTARRIEILREIAQSPKGLRIADLTIVLDDKKLSEIVRALYVENLLDASKCMTGKQGRPSLRYAINDAGRAALGMV